MEDADGAMKPAQAIVSELGSVLRGVDFTSKSSSLLSLIWSGLFFSSLVFPCLPPMADVFLVDCILGSVSQSITIPRIGCTEPFASVVFCYAASPGNSPLSLLLVSNCILGPFGGKGASSSVASTAGDVLYVTHHGAADCKLQSRKVRALCTIVLRGGPVCISLGLGDELSVAHFSVNAPSCCRQQSSLESCIPKAGRCNQKSLPSWTGTGTRRRVMTSCR